MTTRGKYYNRTNTCDECKIGKLGHHNAHRECDKKGNWTGKWLCNDCYQNQTDKDLISKIKQRKYNDSNTCDRCGINFDKAYSAGRHYKEYNKDEKWTGKWLCHRCYSVDDKKRPDHIYNLIKAINKCTSKSYNYNVTDTCDRCGTNLISTTYPRREYDENGNWTGKWDCYKCYSKYDPNSKINLLKSIGDRITNNQNPNSSNAKGDKFQKLTCKWLNVEDLNITNNDFHSPIDHSKHPILGILQTKGRLYNHHYKRWDLNAESEHNKEFDILIFYCASENGMYIERIYIFPLEEIIERTTISIYMNSSRYSWTEKYRIQDMNILKYVNDIWKEIIIDTI